MYLPYIQFAELALNFIIIVFFSLNFYSYIFVIILLRHYRYKDATICHMLIDQLLFKKNLIHYMTSTRSSKKSLYMQFKSILILFYISGTTLYINLSYYHIHVHYTVYGIYYNIPYFAYCIVLNRTILT